MRLRRASSLPRYLAVVLSGAGPDVQADARHRSLVLLLLDYWPLERFRIRRRLRSASRLVDRPLAGGLAAAGGKDSAAGPVGDQLPDHHVVSRIRFGQARHRRQIAVWPRAWPMRLVAYAAYVGQSFCPVDMAAAYPHLAAFAGWVDRRIGGPAGRDHPVAVYWWRRRPYLIVGWLWFLGMLVPVLGLVGRFTLARADRYTYLSQIGLSLAVAFGVLEVYRSRQAVAAARWRSWTLALAREAAVLALALVAWRQTDIGRMPRPFGRIRWSARKKMRRRNSVSPMPTPSREEPTKRSPIFAKPWRLARSNGL